VHHPTGHLRAAHRATVAGQGEHYPAERGGAAYGQACGGDCRRRSDGDDAGG
jgi:hypothetical protein